MSILAWMAIGAAALVYFALDAQLNPITLCEDCNGKPPGDGKGNFHYCGTCGGSPQRLRAGAWIQLKMGIPVPRSRRSTKRRRMSL